MTRPLEIKQPFNLELSLMMGQAFRWRKLPMDFYGDGHQWFSGVLGDNLIHIHQVGGLNGPVEYRIGGPRGKCDADDKHDEMLRRYFREDDDVEAMQQDLMCKDAHIAAVINRHRGLRLIRQDPWVCLVTYILSAVAQVERMDSNVESIATLNPQMLRLGCDQRHVFPTATQVVAAGEERLSKLGLIGLPAFPSRIYAAASRIESGILKLNDLQHADYARARNELKECDGIGDKIADCIALFSLDKLEAFPVDTHIRKALAAWPDCPTRSYQATANWARDYFGPYAGYAGQFLFRDQRTGKGDDVNTQRLREQENQPVGERQPAESVSRYPNRAYACPTCGATVGISCRYPSGYYYSKGHSARGPRA